MAELRRGLRMPGPFAVQVEGFRQALAGLGISPRTARDHGYVLTAKPLAGRRAPES